MLSEQQHADWRDTALTLEPAIGGVIVGQSALIRLINIALFARGHVLLEGDVGVGKTIVYAPLRERLAESLNVSKALST